MDKTAVAALAHKARACLEAAAHRELRALRAERLPNNDGLLQDQLLQKASVMGENALCQQAAFRFFMQLTGIRYMEANGWLTQRVLTPRPGGTLPQLLENWLETHEDTLDRDSLYTHLFRQECARLHERMPDFFPTPNCLDLLLTLRLRLGTAAFFRDTLPEEAWCGGVEIVGWLYQYYHTEEKDKAIDVYRGAVKMSDVPAATQFFTTDWIVQYMVQNTLGRVWLEGHPDSSLRSKMPYFLDTPLKASRPPMPPTALRLLDPCMGSGHILVYAFQLLLHIYAECGIPAAQAAPLILKHNLWGLDLDEKSRQLAAFALLMQARSCDPEILQHAPKLHLCAMHGSGDVPQEALDYAANGNMELSAALQRLMEAYQGAEQYGSLAEAPDVPLTVLQKRFAQMQAEEEPGDLFLIEARRLALETLLPLLYQTEILAGTYDAVVTNPPYLNHMAKPLKKYVDRRWPDCNNDLFAAFLLRDFQFCAPGGYCGCMTPFVWMFIKSYEKLREYLTREKAVSSLVQLAYSAFEEATVPLCTFVLHNAPESVPGRYLRLTSFSGGMEEMARRVRQAAAQSGAAWDYTARLADFRKLPGCPLAYWAGEATARVFRDGTPLGSTTPICNGLFTCNNKRFLRLWWEVTPGSIDFTCHSEQNCRTSHCRWFPYNKGGAYRKWYGNQEWVVDFANFGEAVRHYRLQSGQSAALPGQQHYFSPSLSWGFVSSSKFGVRAYPAGFVFDIAGSSLFPSDTDRLYRLGFLGSSTAFQLLQILNPTLNCQAGDIARLPILESRSRDKVEALVQENIALTRQDWNECETSWDFRAPPLLLTGGCTLPQAWEERKAAANARFEKLKQNEIFINRHFARLYGTGAAAVPEERDLSVQPATLEQDALALTSYFVGIYFGRFTCDFWRPQQPKPVLLLEEAPALFAAFMEARFGTGAAEQLAPYLGKGQPDTVLKRWFSRSFFRRHSRMYHQRPIYWQTSIGVPALLYCHKDLPAALRFLAALSPQEPALSRLAAQPPQFDPNDGIPANRAKLQEILRKA